MMGKVSFRWIALFMTVYYMSITRACFVMKKGGSSMIQELTTMISLWSSVLEKGLPANVLEGAHVQWEIELLGFEMPKDWTGLKFKSIMDDAEKIRLTKSNFGNDGSAVRGLSRFGHGKSTRLDEKEADEMASQGGYEDSKVEGHDREHD